MTTVTTLFLSSLGLGAVAAGTAAWAHYGGVIFFDILSTGLTGCFF